MNGKRRVEMIKKTVLMVALGVSSFFQVSAETRERAEFAFSELESGTATASIEEAVSVKDMLNTFLGKKGWSEGRNKKSNGSSFIVTTGSGIIHASPGHYTYISARQTAFDKALASAKASLIRYLSTEISADISKSAQQGEFPLPKTVVKKLSIKEKLLLLIHKVLDEKLKEKGISEGTPEADQVLKGILNSEEFSKIIRSASESFIAGFQAYKTFESTPKGKKGRMGVILLWSPLLNEMAGSIKTGRPVQVGKAKSSLLDQVNIDKKILLTTFGVQQTRDENGNYWLISSGQAGLKSDSAMSEDMAEEQARTIAESYIRLFAGENVKRVTDMNQAESCKELVTGAEVYKNESACKTTYLSHAKKMKISGMKVLRKWEMVHPFTNQKVVGVILAWSPISSRNAQDTAQLMKDAGKNKKKKSPKGGKGSYKSSGGFGGDEDDF